MVPGEATITLEDVEVLIGLPTTGRPLIVSPDEQPVPEICEQWLGVQPPPNAVQGRTVRVGWVKRIFDRLPDGASGEVITYHARAYTWVLVAGVLLADQNGDHIPVHLLQLIGDPRVASTYSWGSAVLAWLYKLWALERFPRIAERYIHGGVPPVDDTVPRGARWLPIIERHQHRVAMHLEDIRYAFDLCTDFVWMPYADRTEEFALDGDILWRSVTRLLCIDCIAWHHPDRCIRQFGFDQRVPQDPELAGHVESLLAGRFQVECDKLGG
ncbi:Serine/threonine-protein phosphatase 7 long form homolog [Linum perenne]